MIRVPAITRWLATLFLFALAIIWMVPVWIMVVTALTPPEQRVTGLGGLVVGDLSLRNFQIVLADAPIFSHLANSLVITLTSVALVVMFGAMAGYAFARMRIRGKNAWFFLLITTMMLPGATLIVPLFQINKSLGLLDTYLGLILPYTALGLPFAIIVLRSFFEALPLELEEAARLDGVSQVRIFWYIALPLSWPALTVVVIIQFMSSFNEFLLALIMIDSDSIKPLSLVPMTYSGRYSLQPGAMFATLTLMTLPVLAVYFAMQRFMISGLTAGAVKG
ncbi:MAG: carbohydrate ABC transporter permease [Mesorhizobium sp.]|uniref:carbohydrate ABC transporter permease n=1 Tax=Mesorhizobium sp. TaxID=1871066 RepID=UPI000FE2B95E|nr:carbohydrate ABC transporter permease [Mesorhizobium sp.]RWJ04405.1 MAG: carbohydrate ABC transporter permease [Mesorhizobium sp.]RWJ15168.1 MAG: carbohydrate ABC transporter permease [Mesorhizobium sp.]